MAASEAISAKDMSLLGKWLMLSNSVCCEEDSIGAIPSVRRDAELHDKWVGAAQGKRWQSAKSESTIVTPNAGSLHLTPFLTSCKLLQFASPSLRFEHDITLPNAYPLLIDSEVSSPEGTSCFPPVSMISAQGGEIGETGEEGRSSRATSQGEPCNC